MEIDYFSRFTFDSVSHYQKFGNVEEKTCKWTLLGENTLMYETFAHTELNEEYRKLGVYYMPHKHIIKISKEQYDEWVGFLKTCCLHGDRFPNGDYRTLQRY